MHSLHQVMKKPTIMCKEMHLHDIILGLMQPLGREIHIVLDIFLNQQPYISLFDVKFQELQLFYKQKPLGHIAIYF